MGSLWRPEVPWLLRKDVRREEGVCQKKAKITSRKKRDNTKRGEKVGSRRT